MKPASSASLPVIEGKTGWPWVAPITENIAGTHELPRISIITPSYNQGQYLEETIRSIVLQNYPNYELIIVDGGSTDDTLDVIKKYEPWITYWVSEKDRGQSHAIRKGLDKVTGDIANWINSDDMCAPGAFHHLAADFDLAKYNVLCGYCDYFVETLATLDKRNERMGLAPTVGKTLAQGIMNQPSTFFKASILKELGVNEAFHYAMDLDLWYRYLVKYGKEEVKLSTNLLTYFRLHGTSKSVAENSRFSADIDKVIYNLLHTFNQPAVLTTFVASRITGSEQYVAKPYAVGIKPAEMNDFIADISWQAVSYYNSLKDYVSVRACLRHALKHGHPVNYAMIRQLIKHYLVYPALRR